jgi:hypothetical protein
MGTQIKHIVDLIAILLVLLLFQNVFSSTIDNSTSIRLDQENETIALLESFNDDNSTLISDLQKLQKHNITTARDNPLLMTIQRQPLETSTTPAINLIRNSTAPNRKINTQQTSKVPIRLNSQSKINQLLDAIDSRLKNASMVLDSHVLVMQNSNGAVNVTRTWSFQPNQLKTSGSVRFFEKVKHS